MIVGSAASDLNGYEAGKYLAIANTMAAKAIIVAIAATITANLASATSPLVAILAANR